MVNSNQIQTRLGTNTAGNPVYGNMQDIITPKTPVGGTDINFTLGADGNLIQLSGASLPSGTVYIDGSTYEAINGGVIASSGTDGTHNITTVSVGGREANLARVINSDDDEEINIVLDGTGKVEKRRFVYGLISSSLSDGATVADNKLQANFVSWDDVANAFEAVTIKAGDYQLGINRAYNNGTLALAQKAGRVLSNYDIGGYAQDELLDLQDNKPFYYEIKLDSEATLQADKKIVFTIGADTASSSVADSGGTAITGTESQNETIVFEASDLTKTIFELNGGRVELNGVAVQPSMVTVKATNQIEADLSNTVTGTLYIGDVITLSMQGV